MSNTAVPSGNGPADDAPPADLNVGAPADGQDAPQVDDPDDLLDDGDSGDAQPDGAQAGAADDAVKKARKQAANYRTRAREALAAKEAAEQAAKEAAEQAAQMKKVLDGLQAVLNPDAPKDEPLDPKSLAEQLAASQAALEQERAENAAKLRALQVQAALPKALAKHNADPDLTEAVLARSGVLESLDPSAKNFTASLDAAVKAAVEGNPKLLITPPATRTGVEPTGSAGAAASQLSREQLAKMRPEEIAEALKAGRLQAVLSGTR